MHFLLDQVRSQGCLIVLIASFPENVELPVPTYSFLILAGCLAAEGMVTPPAVLPGAVVDALTANAVWFLFGRWKGSAVLAFFCHLSLNPDACVEGTERQSGARPARSRATAGLDIEWWLRGVAAARHPSRAKVVPAVNGGRCSDLGVPLRWW